MQSAEEFAKAILNETGGYIEPWVKRSIPIIRARDREIVEACKHRVSLEYINTRSEMYIQDRINIILDSVLRDLG